MPLGPRAGRRLYDLEAQDLKLVGRGLRPRFDPAAWQRASLAQREGMARAAHDYIRAGYDLRPQELTLTRGWPENIHGDFDPLTKEVTVNASLLRHDDPTTVLNALAHENRHAVQQERVEGAQPIPYEDRIGREEVTAWTEGACRYTRNEYMDYHYNPLEVDAREAATSVVEEGFWAEHRRLLEERVAEAGR
jgi:hypothetical protein